MSKNIAREIKRSINYTIDVENIEWPNTIFETSDEVTVLEAIQNLLRDHVDHNGRKYQN